MEHDRLRQDTALWQHFSTKTLETKYRLEEIAAEPCLIVRYYQLSPELLHQLDVKAVVVGGQYTALPHYSDAELVGVRTVLHQADRPIIGLCGGLQLIAQMYGGTFGPMNASSFEADDPFTETPLPPDMMTSAEAQAQNVRQEQGFMPVRIIQPHPLLDGLVPEPVFFQLHSWEVKTLPDAFQRLAESDQCNVQIIAHKTAPLFGVQFHPERYDEEHLDGRTILKNFFKLAGVDA
jgi:GMP synthase-like glutamine amidotransferase